MTALFLTVGQPGAGIGLLRLGDRVGLGPVEVIARPAGGDRDEIRFAFDVPLEHGAEVVAFDVEGAADLGVDAAGERQWLVDAGAEQRWIGGAQALGDGFVGRILAGGRQLVGQGVGLGAGGETGSPFALFFQGWCGWFARLWRWRWRGGARRWGAGQSEDRAGFGRRGAHRLVWIANPRRISSRICLSGLSICAYFAKLKKRKPQALTPGVRLGLNQFGANSKAQNGPASLRPFCTVFAPMQEGYDHDSIRFREFSVTPRRRGTDMRNVAPLPPRLAEAFLAFLPVWRAETALMTAAELREAQLGINYLLATNADTTRAVIGGDHV